MAREMKSWIYLGKENIRMQMKPVPEVGPRDVLIRNKYSSICGTDVAVYKNGPHTGHKVSVGASFGHETVSEVAAVGDEVFGFRIGQGVYPYPLYATEDTRKAGNIGGFSEYILVPDALPDHSLYHVPADLPDRIGCI